MEGNTMFAEHYRSIDWGAVAKRTVKEIQADDVFGRAGQLAYFWLFSLVPTLLIIAVILGYVAQGGAMKESLLDMFRRIAPASGFQVVQDSLEQMSSHAGAGKLSFGIVTTIWAASSGMSSIIDGLNKAYEVSDERPWWKGRLVAAGLTIALAVLVVMALAVLLYGAHLGAFVDNKTGLGFVQGAWMWLQWPLVLTFVVAGILVVYRFAPNLHSQKLWLIIPGAVAAAAMWILVSLLLRVYLSYFDSYTTVYGGLGAVLVLMLWLYLCSIALLIGGELNSEIESVAAQVGEPDAKLPGQKAPESEARDAGVH
jgi:membrane protein